MSAKSKLTKSEAKDIARTLLMTHGLSACYFLSDNYSQEDADAVWPYLEKLKARVERALGYEVGEWGWG